MLLPPKCFLLEQETVRDNINKNGPHSISLLPQMTGTFGWQNLGQLSCPLCSETMCWQVISWAITEICGLLSLPGKTVLYWQQQALREDLGLCGLWVSWVCFWFLLAALESDFCLLLVTVADPTFLQMVSGRHPLCPSPL